MAVVLAKLIEDFGFLLVSLSIFVSLLCYLELEFESAVAWFVVLRSFYCCSLD